MEFPQLVVMVMLGQVLAQGVIELEGKATLGHLGGTLQFQTAGGRIARIGEGGLPYLFPLSVQRIEAVEGHNDLATGLQDVGKIAGQAQRHRADGLHVGGHHVATGAVATRNRAGEDAVLVDKTNGHAIVFQLAHILHGTVQQVAHARVKLGEVALRVGVAQREHRIKMRSALELLGDGATHALRRTVGPHILRMLPLQVYQALQQLVEVVVADLRIVQHIVIIVVTIDLLGKARYLLLNIRKLLVLHL